MVTGAAGTGEAGDGEEAGGRVVAAAQAEKNAKSAHTA
jgi:hypothetical protein